MPGNTDSSVNARHRGSAAVRPVCRVLALCLAFACSAHAQSPDRADAGSKTVVGVRNLPLKQGADALIAGNYHDGIRLTHQGLKQAFGVREEEAALSNLCAGYLQIGEYDKALMYCEILLTRNDEHWRGYNNRALIFIKTKQWDKAEADLIRGEELNSGAYTMKLARAMYMDAVHPVAPEIEIDDRDKKGSSENNPQ